MGSQRQRANRNRAFYHGFISYVDGAISIRCIVNQLSETGAQLNLESTIALPDRFAIRIPQKRIDTIARLVWRNHDRAGVELLAEHRAEPFCDDEYQNMRLSYLLAENARLKAHLGILVQQVNRLSDQ
ncbi:MAG: PilZ domain-containing protein [Roseiarcus sp.]